MNSNALLWFRQDLRLTDNPALHAAVRAGIPIIPLYIYSPPEEGSWPIGEASRWWLHRSLEALDASLQTKGSRLILEAGPTLEILEQYIRSRQVKHIYWNRRYEPEALKRDQHIQKHLQGLGVEVQVFNASLLRQPEDIKTQSGTPFQVFTAYWNAFLKAPDIESPLSAPRSIPAPDSWPKSKSLSSLELNPKIAWDAGLRKMWKPGEQSASNHLKQLLKQTLQNYKTTRDLPAMTGTSRLSPYLHFGEISPRQIWHTVCSQYPQGINGAQEGALTYLKELVWREFAYHLLVHFPHTTDKPLREQFARFPWQKNAKALRAWQTGQTGYPIVDAGMRELWTTGWMHNRVRMIVASFLVKHLRISWNSGAKWFWDTLVDADLASNTLGWQWSAGCGADAAPYFRIFNPILQGEKFDPKGEYVKRWVPELAGVETRWIHSPWLSPQPPKDYPSPMVDHPVARKQALIAFGTLASAAGNSPKSPKSNLPPKKPRAK